MVAFCQLISTGFFIPKPKWSVDDIPDLSGKVIIVTGGNAGIGKETTRQLLRHNAKVYIACRSRAKAEATIKELKDTTGKEAIFLELDYGTLESTRNAAKEFLSKETKLDVLVNNAGIMNTPLDVLTDGKYDGQWGTNVLGPFLFTQLLIPALTLAAQSAPDKHARIVNVSSSVHFMHAGTIDFDTLIDGPKRRKLLGARIFLYTQSKFANIVHANELAKRYGDQGIVATSLHPGLIRSNLWDHTQSLITQLSSPMLYGPAQGAVTQLWAATAPETAEYNGKYLSAWARLSKARKDTNDEKLSKEMWEWLEVHSGLKSFSD